VLTINHAMVIISESNDVVPVDCTVSWGVTGRAGFKLVVVPRRNILRGPSTPLNFRFNRFSCLWKGTYKVLHYMHTFLVTVVKITTQKK
jgi:hypothetical protein